MKFDIIDRAKTPTRGDALAARLKSLRSDAESSPVVKQASPQPPRQAPAPSDTGEEDDSVLETDDAALEEMLAGVEDEEKSEPKDEDVKKLLDDLSKSIPKDDDSDNSNGVAMGKKVDDVIAQYKDEAELDEDEPPLDLPSVPDEGEAPSAASLDDITARMAALKANNADLPSVPDGAPSGKSVKRLTSTTKYTDDDVESWCTVCLEDATLRCLGCEDVYCARCWHEMHVGPAAAFDDKTHKAVQFTRDGGKEEKKKKVALGA